MSENVCLKVCPAKIQSRNFTGHIWDSKDEAKLVPADNEGDCAYVQADLRLCWGHVRRYVFKHWGLYIYIYIYIYIYSSYIEIR